MRRSPRKKVKEKHGEASPPTPEYRAWLSMLTRCEWADHPQAKDYSGRGIKVHPPWRVSYLAFLKDVGRRPSDKHTLERKDNDVGYEPGNVVWATRLAQSSNRRSTKLSVDLAEQIRNRAAAGENYNAIADSIGVSACAVRDVLRGRTWRAD